MRPTLNAVQIDTAASPVRYHFSGLQDGAPFSLTLASPISVQASYDLDTPDCWEVLVKDGPVMSLSAPGDMYAFAVDRQTPEGRAALLALGYRS